MKPQIGCVQSIVKGHIHKLQITHPSDCGQKSVFSIQAFCGLEGRLSDEDHLLLQEPILSTHITAHKHLWLQSQGIWDPLLVLHECGAQKTTPIHRMKINKSLKVKNNYNPSFHVWVIEKIQMFDHSWLLCLFSLWLLLTLHTHMYNICSHTWQISFVLVDVTQNSLQVRLGPCKYILCSRHP